MVYIGTNHQIQKGTQHDMKSHNAIYTRVL